MDKKRVSQIKEQFDLVIHSDEGAHIEFWYARELMPLLGYERWENFDKAVSRAMESCETSGIDVADHFRDLTKMIVNVDTLRVTRFYSTIDGSRQELSPEVRQGKKRYGHR